MAAKPNYFDELAANILIKSHQMEDISFIRYISQKLQNEFNDGFKEGWVCREGSKGSTTATERKILKVVHAITDLLFYKNKKYGDSALKPINVFSKDSATNSIAIRMDDKLSRIVNGSDLNSIEKRQFYDLFSRVMGRNELEKNNVADLNGYLILLQAANEWWDLHEFKD